ncbi:MAG: hypothetical protein GY841_09545 [FCB group bacterium]|nr:hypothetical protein [FCB group bacterium]
MAVLKQPTIKQKSGAPEKVEKSIYATNVRIDREGNPWQKKGVWLREEHLGKLKVIAHFEKTTTQNLIDMALGEFIKDKLDNSMAVRKLVENK